MARRVEGRLPVRAEHAVHGLLDPPVHDIGNAKATLAATWLRNPHPANHPRAIGSVEQGDAARAEARRDACAPRRCSGRPDREPRGSVPLPQTRQSGFHRSPPPPSSSPAGSLQACFSTSAPHTGQRVRVGPSLCRERPLAGCRLSRETGLVGLPVHWPWSPSLAAGCARVGPPFDGLPVLRDHPTPLVSSSSCRWFLDDYRASRGSREVSSGKHTELRTDAVAYTPACPTDMGFTAVGQLTPGLDASHSASLSLGSGTASSDFYRTLPRGWCGLANALVSLMVGFLRQDPKRT